jgi:superfamily II DNA/RNA helicase
LIFDEADKLLETGFEFEIKEIVKSINPERQTLLFSATLSPNV